MGFTFGERQRSVGSRDSFFKGCTQSVTFSKTQGKSNNWKGAWVKSTCRSWRSFSLSERLEANEGHLGDTKPFWGACFTTWTLELANAILKSCSSLLILGLGPKPQFFYTRIGTTQVNELAEWEHKPAHQQVNSSSETPWTFLRDLTPLTNGQYQLWDTLASQPAMSGTGRLNRRSTLDWDLRFGHHTLRTQLHTLVHQD